MKVDIGFFAATRYWNDDSKLQAAYQEMSSSLAPLSQHSALILEEGDLEKSLTGGDCLVIVPMSGAVQRMILAAAKKYRTVVIYPAYIQGNAGKALEDEMLKNNAAPTTMDCWAVLRRTHDHACIALNRQELEKTVRVFAAYIAMQGATLLLIGNTEPWVISNSDDLKQYEKLGVKIRQIAQEEVAQLYRTLPDSAGEEYYSYFKGDEKEVVEPTDDDIKASCKMAAALVQTIEKYKADGIALACFNLLAEGTNSCLGVSYINDCTRYIAACEGDVDSAVTMLAMKQLAKTKLWMANPGLHPDGTINFSHCTAPVNMFGGQKCPYTLRNHHESGIGTSLQVEYPVGKTVTACRISDNAQKITIQKGVTVAGEYECACRTQVYIKLDDFNRYLETALGCHQVFAFEDIADEMRMLAKQLNLQIL